MNKKWFKEAVVYQIYPRSFKDSNNDGIGDIKGITSKLEYLTDLGVNVVWLSPVYKSPNDDNGYDISDYRDIMKDFGDMSDWEELINEMHKRNLKLVMDLVVNHTSDEHFWFKEAKKSTDNKYRDYYIWKKGENGKAPNKIQSMFGGSAWEFDENTGEYYLHLFSKKQADLNWENENLRREIYSMMKFWLDKGVDGFRMDVINLIAKPKFDPDMDKYVIDEEKLHFYLKEMNREVLSKYDILTVGETPYVTTQLAKDITNEDRYELNMVFEFEHVDLTLKEGVGKWNLSKTNVKDLKNNFSKWQRELADTGWNSLYLNNHDQPRLISKFGDDKNYREKSGKLFAMMLHTLKGTPYIFQGEEIGMVNCDFKDMSQIRDVESINMSKILKNDFKLSDDEIMAVIKAVGRDNARTPMQWDDSQNAGFSEGEPWLKVNPNYKEINVKKQIDDKNSFLFSFYKELIKLRKEHDVIVYGEFVEKFEDEEKIFAYERNLNENLFVLLNLSNEEIKLTLDDKYLDYKPLISNVTNLKVIKNMTLLPYDGFVLIK